ncbi:uncharacterized protein BDR25DRAFT_356932 [Lindgomyces ingoldianus]|uniref:Uncharacterized protein n=1 Tax=Lindgomyces ingoldianus TaxID=673940 RepID=A0ACB6QQ88_9PLEO|nr:uncharacterized protein BDR25DRAFT_356932 [Lindgomyces ingoldianus]KAF2469149.1 hypothetical protein BDR25DRAFT_356932 [Lindgomyces ingoldianus]
MTDKFLDEKLHLALLILIFHSQNSLQMLSLCTFYGFPSPLLWGPDEVGLESSFQSGCSHSEYAAFDRFIFTFSSLPILYTLARQPQAFYRCIYHLRYLPTPMAPCRGRRPRRRGQSWKTHTPAEVREIMKAYPSLKYPELQDERMWARPQHKAFPFMSLPPELRLKVYRHHLLSSSPIELWPHVKNNTMYSANWRRANSLHAYMWLNHKLGLLRVSSIIHLEASQVFYGENEFRFTGINGWMVCSLYLNTIGPQHFRFLRHITLHVPFPGTDYLAMPTFANHTLAEKICLLRPHQHVNFGERMRKYGFLIPQDWSYDWSISNVVELLSRADLQTFRLVLPPTYHIHHDSSLTWYWDKLKLLKDAVDTYRASQAKSPLDIRFAFLKIRDGEQEPSFDMLDFILGPRFERPWLRRYTGECRQMIERVRRADWIAKVEYGVHDKAGIYGLMDRESCLKVTGPGALKKEGLDEDDWKRGIGGECESVSSSLIHLYGPRIRVSGLQLVLLFIISPATYFGNQESIFPSDFLSIDLKAKKISKFTLAIIRRYSKPSYFNFFEITKKSLKLTLEANNDSPIVHHILILQLGASYQALSIDLSRSDVIINRESYRQVVVATSKRRSHRCLSSKFWIPRHKFTLRYRQFMSVVVIRSIAAWNIDLLLVCIHSRRVPYQFIKKTVIRRTRFNSRLVPSKNSTLWVTSASQVRLSDLLFELNLKSALIVLLEPVFQYVIMDKIEHVNQTASMINHLKEYPTHLGSPTTHVFQLLLGHTSHQKAQTPLEMKRNCTIPLLQSQASLPPNFELNCYIS